jgi:hypothetical protein
MVLAARDRQIVTLVDRFGQLSSAHICSLVFSSNASSTPCDRALKRLVNEKMLARVERARLVGGVRGGSGSYVYQLGRAGWAVVGREGRYYGSSVVNYHSLAIADTYVALRTAEHDGWLQVLDYGTEPDCWAVVGGQELKPDLYAELALMSSGIKLAAWLEVDLGTERQRQIKDKLQRYWNAYQRADESELPVFPLVLFLVPDEARRREVEAVVDRGPEEGQALFRVVEQSSFPQVLMG